MGSACRKVTFLLMLLVGLGCAAGASARQVDQPDAGKTYEHIWGTIDVDLWEAVGELRSVAPAWYPERASSKILVANQEAVERLIDATRIGATPLAAETDGWSQLTSDTRNYRRTATLFSVDATRLLAEDNADGAAGRIAALLRMAGQLATEPRLSSTALAASCIQMVEEQIELVCKSPSLTEVGRREMVAAVVALDPRDPAGFKTGLSGACRLAAWIEREFKGSTAGEQLVESMPIPEERKQPLADGMQEERGRRGGWGGRRNGGLWPSRELVAQLRELDGEEIEKAAADFDTLYKAAMSVWHEPDAIDQLERLDLQTNRNGFGPLARLTPPWFSRQRRAADRVDSSMAKIELLLVAR